MNKNIENLQDEISELKHEIMNLYSYLAAALLLDGLTKDEDRKWFVERMKKNTKINEVKEILKIHLNR